MRQVLNVFICAVFGELRRSKERRRSFRDVSKHPKQSRVECGEFHSFSDGQFDQENVVGGDIRLDRTPERAAPQLAHGHALNTELRYRLKPERAFIRRDDSFTDRHPNDAQNFSLLGSGCRYRNDPPPELRAFPGIRFGVQQVVCDDVGVDNGVHSRPTRFQRSTSLALGRLACLVQDSSI